MLEIDGRHILTTLEEKVSPDHAAVIVIDCQKEFTTPGCFWDELGQDVAATGAVAQRLESFLEQARACGVRIVHVRANYDPEYMNDPMYERLHRHGSRKYCQSGDPASEFHPGLEPRAGEPQVVKHRYDAFYDTELDLVLQSWGIKTVILTGFVTHGCVDSTARHAYFKGYYVVLADDLTGGADEAVQRMTADSVELMFGVTASSAAIAGAWRTDARWETAGASVAAGAA